MDMKYLKKITDFYRDRGTNFVNIEKLVDFFDERLKMPYGTYDLEACIENLMCEHGATGGIGFTHYELSPYKSKSGNPELLYYIYSYEWDEENDCLLSETYEF